MVVQGTLEIIRLLTNQLRDSIVENLILTFMLNYDDLFKDLNSSLESVAKRHFISRELINKIVCGFENPKIKEKYEKDFCNYNSNFNYTGTLLSSESLSP